MYETILVGTDGSAPANRAVVQAIEGAQEHGATVHAIFVVDTALYDEPAFSSAELSTDELEDWGHEQLEEVVERGANLDVDVVTKLSHGTPFEEIIEYGDEIDADLVVLGYQGQSHDRTDHMGSVTARVLRNAGRQVLVV